jgi:hypothetical protein
MVDVPHIAAGVLSKLAKKKPEPGEMPDEPKIEGESKLKPGKTLWSKDQRKAMSDASSLGSLKRFGKNVAKDKPIAKWASVAHGVLLKMGYNVKQISTTAPGSAANDRLNSATVPRTLGGNDTSKASQKNPKASNVHVTTLG